MRIVEAEFESSERSDYNFLGCSLNGISNEPFFLRHEYYDAEKDLKRSLYLFGKRANERGTQIFVHKYFNYQNNSKFKDDLNFYQSQAANFRLPNKDTLTKTYLLTDVIGEKNTNQFMTKDGRYRRRIVHEITGDTNALLIVFSLDSNLFPENQFFKFIKNNFVVNIE